jgi:glutamate racemase
MSNHRPIGIFDSGLGGLTVAKEIYRLLPNESTIYIGDTARVPYGNRSREAVTQFTQELIDALLTLDVKAVVIACGTASSVALPNLQDAYKQIPIIGVIEPAAENAVSVTTSNHIGVIGTQATIASNSFGNFIKKSNPHIEIHNQSCPLFVPIVEEGIINDHPILLEAIKHYLNKLQQTQIDTLILGCTHYPIISHAIADYLPGVNLINAGVSVAQELNHLLINNHIENTSAKSPRHRYFVTDINQNFEEVAQTFLGKQISIEKIAI